MTAYRPYLLNVLLCASVLMTSGIAFAAEKPAADQDTPSLKTVHKVYIDKMPNDLDQYLRVEIMKQLKGKLIVVLDPKEADGILAGVDTEEKGTGAKVTGRYLGLHDVATGTVSLLDKDGKVLLWSGEAGDRNLFWGPLARGGQRKVADRLISQLKSSLSGAK